VLRSERAPGEVVRGDPIVDGKVHRHQHGRSLGSTHYDLTIHQLRVVVADEHRGRDRGST
jgi:hypothetical protein